MRASKNSISNVIESNKALIETYFYDVWNKGDLTRLGSIIDPNYINHNPITADPIPGPDGLKPIIIAMRNGIPDLFYEIQKTIITADHVVARVQVTGTHLGTLFGIPPTGKPSRFSKST